jgi:hypothetical protein
MHHLNKHGDERSNFGGEDTVYHESGRKAYWALLSTRRNQM